MNYSEEILIEKQLLWKCSFFLCNSACLSSASHRICQPMSVCLSDLCLSVCVSACLYACLSVLCVSHCIF